MEHFANVCRNSKEKVNVGEVSGQEKSFIGTASCAATERKWGVTVTIDKLEVTFKGGTEANKICIPE